MILIEYVCQELEEAEMELDILQKEDTPLKESKEGCQIPSLECNYLCPYNGHYVYWPCAINV